MRNRTIVLLLMASAALLMMTPSRATNVAAPKAESQAQSVNVILHPPDGWTTPVNISNLPGESGLPSIAVDDNGKAYVCWEEWYGGLGDPRSMCFNTNYSGSWGTSQENFLYYVAIDDVGFPTIACDPSDGTAYLAYHDGDIPNQNMEVMFKEYTRGTKTWEGFISGTPFASDYTNLAVDPVSRIPYCMWFDDLTGTDTFELVYKWRNTTTKQWSSLLTVPVFTGRSKYWREMVIDKNGTAHLAFILRSPTEVWYAKNPTPQNANTWTAPVSISGNTDRDWAMPRIAADKDGEAYIVWHANTGGYESATEEVWFRKTVNGVWQAPENLSNSPTRSEGEVIAVDPDTKDIYVVWNELVSAGNWEVYLRMYASQTPGAAKSWGDIYNMTNDDLHSAEPFIRMDGKKGLHLVYHDYIGANREIMYMYKKGSNITVTSPAAGDNWQALTSRAITWTTLGTVTNVKIEYSTDGGTSYTTIVASTPNTGTYSWTVPNAGSTNCRVRVSEATTASPTGTSGVFTISPIFITVTSPTATDSWEALTSHSITWTTTGTAANVKIEYSTDGGTNYTTIVASTTNTGSYTWTVPNAPSTNCRVRVSETTTGSPTGTSGTFTISPIFITVTSPTATDSWEALISHSIAWTTTGTAANVKLEYSTDGGASYTAIVASTPNTGSYSWAVPNAPSTNCRVRVSEAATGVPTGTSPVFTIVRPRVNPPVNLAVDSSLTAAEDRKTNSLAWAANSSNSGITVTNYKIYRKAAGAADSTFAYLDQVSGSTFVYADANLGAVARYAYRLTAVSSLGIESYPGDSVTDKPGVFAPAGVSMTTAANRVLFFEITDNTITFTASPNNAASDIGGYDVYRRKASESDSALALLTSLDASTLSYTDAQLRGSQKYAYALKTRFKDGRTSGFSTVVLEK